MAMLSGPAIAEQIGAGQIKIAPLDLSNPNAVGPNSVDLRLSPCLKTYVRPPAPVRALRHLGSWFGLCDPWCLDMRRPRAVRRLNIPDKGLILWPGELYLGSTVEWTETPHHAPFIEGRSSVGRLGLSVHSSAGFGDQGFRGCWTLEIVVTLPVRVYPYERVCQIAYAEIVGRPKPYDGKYAGLYEAAGSLMYADDRS